MWIGTPVSTMQMSGESICFFFIFGLLNALDMAKKKRNKREPYKIFKFTTTKKKKNKCKHATEKSWDG